MDTILIRIYKVYYAVKFVNTVPRYSTFRHAHNTFNLTLFNPDLLNLFPSSSIFTLPSAYKTKNFKSILNFTTTTNSYSSHCDVQTKCEAAPHAI